MGHYALFLQQFVFDIRYRRSEDNLNADALSRLPLSSEELFVRTDDTTVFHISQMETLPISKRELALATVTDPETRSILDGLRAGVTYNAPYTCEGDVLFLGMRVYVPKSLRDRVLEELHDGHIGTSKMKALARAHVYWPKIDQDIEKITKACTACILTSREPDKLQRQHSWEPAAFPWDRVHVDFAGPIEG